MRRALLVFCWVWPVAVWALPGGYLDESDDWYRSDDGRRIAESVLSYQSAEFGGWPKNVDTTQERPQKFDASAARPTFDNSATLVEMRLLARFYRATENPAYRRAFERGLDYILRAQYRSGGWPQSYPPDDSYHRRITFNDGAMANVLGFLQEICTEDLYAFLGSERRAVVQEAVDRGIDCIVRAQVRVNGVPTVWCAQHDEETLRPAKGRKYELVSLSGAESTDVVRVLMNVPHPAPAVVAAVEAAVAWFRRSEIRGVRVVERPKEKTPGRWREVIPDARAKGIWARMYEVETNEPMFAGRDGIPCVGLDQAGFGRPGYEWFGVWPRKLLDKDYPAWRERLTARAR
ncbi:MAG TPA: pectate lyase [Terrimicrobiaceae bacterium]|nr:pectate lyase [Terrimicrobiaceae bacterium]